MENKQYKTKYLRMKRMYLKLKKQMKGGNGLLIKCPYCQASNDNQYPYQSLPPKQQCKQCKGYFTQEQAINIL